MAEEPRPPEKRPRVRPRFWVIVLVLLAVNYLSVALFAPGKEKSVRIPYSPEFLSQVDKGNVAKVSSTGATISGELNKAIKYPPDDKDAESTKNFDTEIPIFANGDELDAKLQEKKVEISAEPVNPGRGALMSLILGFGPVILLVGLFIWFARRAGGGQMSALGNFGRSRARRVEGGTTNVTFADVAGIDESKAELTEVVDYLKNPDRYRRLGGRIPRGVLLSGRPGTGKTLLARAVAGEANVPFFSVSASEFVEAIVGIGASRVRDLFKQAKESSPAIIFIDELDAIGRSRTSGSSPFSGGNDEREQTLNQILTEMDGFESNVAVIVLGATNRPEILDQALLRPGRSRAGSSTSGRLVAAMRMTPSLVSKPSISTSSWFRVCSRSSWPPPRPAPRWRPTASISSMKTMQGAFFLPCSNRSRTRDAPTPTNISTKSDPLIEKNGTLASPATARASSVLPVPGGPDSSTPCGMRAPSRRYFSGARRKSTTSLSSCFASSMPATSANVMRSGAGS